MFPLLLRNRNGVNDLFEQMFSDLFDKKTTNILKSDFGLDLGKNSFPKIDVLENEKSLIFYVDLPGFKKEDITVDYSFEDECLSISSKSDNKREYDEMKDEKTIFLRKEIKRSKFVRSFSISKKVYETDRIKSSFKDGLLRIEIEKREFYNKQNKSVTIDIT